ncbi:hypothetical protein PGT21_015925 [Puccinia graminis f. sp. tritici]|uniref:Uncharacterized protein n=1 Tax=Puccinia graminis f. sp. tritici TaxID=56615 RepID=A0A5B0MEY6_PUCGR|nr:hypothetical protein PGT21_015925 [Puccinia graminis f. sp. tritici]
MHITFHEAIEIVSAQKPVSGLAPKGSYNSSATLSDAFFTKEEREARNRTLTARMPFLYRLVCAKLKCDKPGLVEDLPSDCPRDPLEDNSDDEDDSDQSDNLVDYDGSVMKKSKDPATRRAIRVQTVSSIPAIGLTTADKYVLWKHQITGCPDGLCNGRIWL